MEAMREETQAEEQQIGQERAHSAPIQAAGMSSARELALVKVLCLPLFQTYHDHVGHLAGFPHQGSVRDLYAGVGD